MVAAARALKTDDELAAVPLSQGVVIELPDGVTVPEAGGAADPAGKDAKPAKTEPDADDPVEALRAQLKASEDARKIDADRITKAERDAADARRVAGERDRELTEARARSVDHESEAIDSGLAAAQSEDKAARAALTSAIESGNAEAQGEAAARIGRAASDIREFERAQATLAADREREKNKPAAAAAAPVDPVAAIDADPNLMMVEKDWLKAHSDAVVDPRRNARLGVAYDDAIAKGLIRGTKPYFDHLEQFMGYAKADAAAVERNDDMSDVQAPPSRAERDGTGRPSNGRVTLSPEEREIARGMGVSEIEYARQKVAFDAARKADPEKYNGRG